MIKTYVQSQVQRGLQKTDKSWQGTTEMNGLLTLLTRKIPSFLHAFGLLQTLVHVVNEALQYKTSLVQEVHTKTNSPKNP